MLSRFKPQITHSNLRPAKGEKREVSAFIAVAQGQWPHEAEMWLRHLTPLPRTRIT